VDQEKGGAQRWARIDVVECDACDDFQIWLDEQLVHPDKLPVPLPNPDLPESVRADYLEAANILARSPRGAAALLRLGLQRLTVALGQPGTNLNKDIAALVAEGLPARIQQALDILRVVGNNAVHPGQIDLLDDRETAVSLFNLLNLIAEDRISEPNRINAMFDRLPASAKDQVSARDSKPPDSGETG
jgi:hypothetical protein